MPTRSQYLPDKAVGGGGKTGGLEGGNDLSPRGHLTFGERAKPGKEVELWRRRVQRTIADRDDATAAKDTPAFASRAGDVGQMVDDHRHEHQIGGAVGNGNSLTGRRKEPHAPASRFPAGVLQHALRWVDGGDLSAKVERQGFAVAARATAEVDNMLQLCGGMRGHQVQPLPQYLGWVAAPAIVHLGDRRPVVIHQAMPASARIA